MRGNAVKYLISEGVKYVWINKVMSVASVGVLATCLFIMGSFWLMTQNVSVNLKMVEDQNEIVVFLSDELDESGVTRVGTRLSALDNVAQTKLTTKDEAMKDFKEKYVNQASLIESLGQENPLRNSYSIKLKDLSFYDETLYQIEGISGIESIRSRSDITDKLVAIGSVLSFLGALVMGLLLVTSLFIIVNTIKLARFVHRKEINIMKYVGATNWFIRWPFIIEGGVLGLIAGVLAFGAQWYIYVYVIETLFSTNNLLISIIPFEELSRGVLTAFLAGGSAIGVIGSAITIRKYLEV